MRLLTGDSKEKLKELPDNSVDSLVTDPPYLINFMGKDWDKENSPAGDSSFWKEVLRVMKPGAHGLVFGHSRQHHRVMTALEDAGFEIRDCLMWIYGSGFPKSHNIGKAADKLGNDHWDGWGTALKPAYEPIILVRKPLEKNLSVAKNVLKHGTGGINIDASRIATNEDFSSVKPRQIQKLNSLNHEDSDTWKAAKDKLQNLGRFPANVLLDPVSAEMVDKQSGTSKSSSSSYAARANKKENRSSQVPPTKSSEEIAGYNDEGGASRFFYCAKVGKKERNAGCDGNTHPTVKPIKLMTYLTKLITPPNGVVLDPFMGSGSTGCACAAEGFDFIGIEMDPDYVEISKRRIDYYTPEGEE